MTKTYPLVEQQALLVSGELCAAIIAEELRKIGTMSAYDQELYESDLEQFLEKAVRGDRDLNTGYYTDISEADAILDTHGIEHEYCPQFYGNCVSRAGTEQEFDKEYDGECICCLTHKRKPDIYHDIYHAIYESPEELVAEYKETLKDLIPENLDLKRYLTDISGVYTS